MASSQKRIAVVGAGVSGLVSVASLKEVGLEPVCFEITDNPGGVWCYRQDSVEGVPSIMPTTIINISKELGALSNFPPRKEYNNFMRHHEMNQYFMEYCAKNDVLRHIQFNSEVTEIRRTEDYEDSGRWIVTVKNTLTKDITSDVYDGVLVCVGHLNRPKMPTYPGQESFKGKIMHTHSLKEVKEFYNKNVVVVGMGCSGMDAAVETSNVAKQVYISTRSGTHVINRVGEQGVPYDYKILRRYLTIFLDMSPVFASYMMERLFLDPKFNHKLYTIPPKRQVFSKDPALSDHINSKLLSGAIIQKSAVERFTEKGVVFQGDDNETEADVVIMATGYTWKFPFLEEGVLVRDGDVINLYKNVFPPQLPHATLGFIGFFLSFGPAFPVIEMQARYASHFLSNNLQLPSKEIMFKDIRDRYNRNVARYERCERSSIRIDVVPYSDDLAAQIGVKPNFLKTFFTDIRLFTRLCFGPFVSYQYRLRGPHSWEGAREAIMTCEQRMLWPLKKSDDTPSQENFFLRVLIKLLRLIIVF